MRIGSFTLAVVGVVAAAATLALNTIQPSSINLHSHSHSVQVADDFDAYIAEHGKSYETKEEYEFRRAQFNKAKVEIASLNAQNSEATFGFNKFSDWTEEEYEQLLGYRADIEREHIHSQTLDESVVNGPVDWRAQGKVNAVKNQASCGSCWAFSAVSAMESAHAIKTGSLVRMSEQMVVDCSRSNYGCQGGWYYTAWSDVQKLGGVPTESSYPYTGRDGTCKKSTPVANVTGSKKIRANDPEQIKSALTTGPVSIALSAGNRAFQSYTGGIWNGAGCGTQLDHAVITVGWGSQGGQDYFIVRNSWGATWGDRGYIHLQAQSGKGPCGMNSEPWQVSTN